MSVASPFAIQLGNSPVPGKRSLIQWVLDEWRIKGQPVSFADYPEMPEILLDDCPDINFRKAAQCGYTELMMMWAFWVAIELQMTSLFFFPTDGAVQEFVNLRVDPMLEEATFTRSILRDGVPIGAGGDLDNKRNKRFGRGIAAFRGTKSVQDVTSLPADMVIIDEIDNCTQAHLPEAEKRLLKSKLHLIRRGGHPYLPMGPSDRAFQASDQRFWNTKCEACGLWQTIDWHQNVVREGDGDGPAFLPRDPAVTVQAARGFASDRWHDALHDFGDIRPVCRSCEAPLNRHEKDRKKVGWVAEFPGRHSHGYQLSQLHSRERSMAEFYREFMLAQVNVWKLADFYRKICGLPSDVAAEGLSREILAAAAAEVTYDPEKFPGEFTSGGVDVGKVMHVRISRWVDGRRYAIVKRTVSEFKDVARLLDRYGVNVTTVDALPETREVEKFRASRPHGSVYLCSFGIHGDGSEKDGSDWFRPDHRQGHLQVDRTMIFDEMMTAIISTPRRSFYPKAWLEDTEWCDHMCAPKRVIVEGREGKERAVYDESGQPDHYCLADLYDYISHELFLHRRRRGAAPAHVEVNREVTPEQRAQGLEEMIVPANLSDEDTDMLTKIIRGRRG